MMYRLWPVPLVLVACAGPAAAQTVDPLLWTADNATVTAVARSGNLLYLAGSFDSFGPPSGSGVPVDAREGTPLPHYPKVAGLIEAVVADGTGGWYIGGTFAGVGGLPRSNLAHILPDGSVDAWDPRPDGPVNALALAGDRLYVGGRFRSIAGRSQPALAAFELCTRRLAEWDPQIQGWFDGAIEFLWVRSLLAEGRSVYVGGWFNHIGGQPRKNLAELDARTARATAWDPQADDDVLGMVRHGSTLYVGGHFFHVGGQLRKFLAAVDLCTGAATGWDPHVGRVPEDYPYDGGPRVTALALHRGALYVAGAFNRVGGQVRASLAAIDLQTAEPTEWDPQALGFSWDVATPHFYTLVIRGRRVYVGGQFTSLGGKARDYVSGGVTAALDVRTSRALEWDPRPNYLVHALAVSGSTIYMGGRFSSVRDWVRRDGLAALDLTTGRPTIWNPGVDGIVRSLVVSGNKVYLAGQFSTVGGAPRANIAALDATEGRATEWNPGASGPLWALVLDGDKLYAGGWFGAIGGQPRSCIAALDTVTGAATPWNPGADDIVEALLVSRDRVYAGGSFDRIGGKPRSGIAALDAASGTVLDWHSSADAVLTSLALVGRTLYSGGWFRTTDGQVRSRLAALDTATGAATAWWDFDAYELDGVRGYPWVETLAASGNTVYVGGGFGGIGGEKRSCLAAIDATTGAVLPWNPDANGVVWSLAASRDVVFAGGAFNRMGVYPNWGIAALSPAGTERPGIVDVPPPPLPSDLPTLAEVWPNPVRSNGVVHFTLPQAAVTSLDVFDVQGRRLARLLDHEPRPAGSHTVEVHAAGWPAGCYLYRLEAGGFVATRKLSVVR